MKCIHTKIFSSLPGSHVHMLSRPMDENEIDHLFLVAD